MADIEFIKDNSGRDYCLDYFEVVSYPKPKQVASVIDIFHALENGLPIPDSPLCDAEVFRKHLFDVFLLTEEMRLKSWKNEIFYNPELQITCVWDQNDSVKVQSKSKTGINFGRLIEHIKFLREKSIRFDYRRIDFARHSSSPLMFPFNKLLIGEDDYWVTKSGQDSTLVPTIINRYSRGQSSSTYFYGSSFTIAHYDRRARVENLKRRLETGRLKQPLRIAQIESAIETFQKEWAHVSSDIQLNRFEWRIREVRALKHYKKILNTIIDQNEDVRTIYTLFFKLASAHFLKTHPIQNSKRQKCDVWASYFDVCS